MTKLPLQYMVKFVLRIEKYQRTDLYAVDVIYSPWVGFRTFYFPAGEYGWQRPAGGICTVFTYICSEVLVWSKSIDGLYQRECTMNRGEYYKKQ
jgi:hypothetical protein